MAKDNNYPANSELGAEHHLNIVKIAIPHIVQLFKSLFKLVLHFLVGGAQIIIGGAQFNFGGARAPPKRYKSTPLVFNVTYGGNYLFVKFFGLFIAKN